MQVQELYYGFSQFSSFSRIFLNDKTSLTISEPDDHFSLRISLKKHSHRKINFFVQYFSLHLSFKTCVVARLNTKRNLVKRLV